MNDDCEPKTLKEDNITIQMKGIYIQVTKYEDLINDLESKMQPLLKASGLDERTEGEDERAESSPAINQMYVKACTLSDLNKRMENLVNRIDL